ncbi:MULTISPECIES: FAD-binding protein [unclassified Streptomyces]|uniref:FAD-binding protein n=1 Tax=unclassified Streptomyces TaxID=2593676 RepID=UPI0038068B0D
MVTVDPGDIARASTDFGHIVSASPLGVLRPRSAWEIAEAARFAGPRGVPVAARGGGYALYGQGQAGGGLVVDMAALDEVWVEEGADGARAVVGAGASWADVVRATLAEGLTPPVLTGHLGASVGGVLSEGGIGGTSHRYGSVADTVLELDVVTGAGEELTCSPDRNRDLFHAVLAGLGRCALIVRATLRLVPAPARVRRYRLYYQDQDRYFADQRRLVLDGRFDQLDGRVRPVVGDGWHRMAEAVVHLSAEEITGNRTPEGRALDERLLGDLGHDRDTQEIEDFTYQEYVHRADREERLLRATGEWRHPHPWLSLLLPEATAPALVDAILTDRAQCGLRTCGVVGIQPLRAASLGLPLLRKPSGELLYLLSLMRTAPDPSVAPAAAGQLVAANRAVYERAVALGAVVLPGGALPMSPQDWRAHYGPAWPGIVRAKETHDPHRVLTPGQGL